MSHGATVRAFRRSLGLTQLAFARAVGVHEATIRRWETGRMRPSTRAYAAMAKLGPITTAADAPCHEPALERAPWPAGSFGEYTEEWLAIHLPRLRPGSRRTYTSQLRRHVLPALGMKPLDGLTRADVRAMLRGCLMKKLAHGSVRFIGVVTAAVVSTAYDDELIATDPSHRAMRRLVFRVPGPRARRAFTSGEAVRFLEAAEARAHRLDYLAFRLLARTGLRIGELCGLTWRSVDLKAGTLHVAGTYHGSGRFGPTKSGVGRTVPLTPDAVHVLEELLALTGGSGFILPSRQLADRPVSPNWLQAVARQIACELGFGLDLSPHSFRHAAATHLISAGVNVLVVRDLLGHADLETTMGYAKRATVQDAAAVARLDTFAAR